MPAGASYYPMRPAFELQLGTPLLEGMAAIGRFDGTTPSLACATGTQRVVVHTRASHDTTTSSTTTTVNPPVRTLNFSRPPTALAVGRVRDTAGRRNVDALYVGAATSLLAYDVERNAEYFFRDVEDGVQAVVCGVMNTTKGLNSGGFPTPLAVVGGNCTINGFDERGDEVLWTVTGDQVTSLMLMPWDASDNEKNNYNSTAKPAYTTVDTSVDSEHRPLALVAASEDFELRIFDGEETIASITEVDRVNQLVYSGTPGRFAYLTANGTVGVYNRTERVWRVKGKHRPVSAAFCDVDFDGVPELIVGWSDGRIEVRGDDNDKRGVLFRDTYTTPVSAVLAYDYRQNGQALPIVCTVDGTVRGLELANTKDEKQEVLRNRETFKLDTLRREREALAAELLSLEEQLEKQRKGDTDLTLPQAGTVVRHTLLPNQKSRKLDVVFTVHHGYADTIIQGCVLHSEKAFPGKEYMFFTLEDPKPTIVCSLAVVHGMEAQVKASVMVGATNADNYQIHEVSFTISRFIMCQPREEYDGQFREPTGYAALQLSEYFPFSKLRTWLETTFTLSNPPDTSVDFRVELVDLRDDSELIIEGYPMHHELYIRGETMEVCGDVVESLGLSTVSEATASCQFPDEMQELQSTLERVEELNAVRLKLNSNMADVAANVKPLLIRAEDSRLISDITSMRRFYAQLYDLDKELIGENMKRCNNYTALKAALKHINIFIMRAGRLRLGEAKTSLIADCRECVKTGETRSLLNLIRTGRK
ncbi:Ciliary BBSome complex subunit 2 [Trypanosoma melophagium]|uniref:Ciliary BBSome complex subunit 2 n=1 Tax=Trypanosoma melophagium TaxID=715481 RepID=UPI00351A4B9B|nr:Ciliary BBSome complex subunit 2 [Trypanosoma melophagium]